MSNHWRATAIIVDLDMVVVSNLCEIAEWADYAAFGFSDFVRARSYIRDRHPLSVVVANLRLGEFNGIHLAYLAKLDRGRDLRAVIYDGRHDPTLAREAQRAGAFYQRQDFLPFSLASLLRAALPTADRRHADSIDRRSAFRGGRRTTDFAGLQDAIVKV